MKFFRIISVLIIGNFILAPQARAEIIDRVVASIGNDAITLYDVEREGASLFDSITKSSTAKEKENRLYLAKKRVLDKLIENLLLLREAENIGLDVGDEEVDAAIENIKRENRITSEELLSALEREGSSYDSYRKKMKAQIIRARVIDRKVRGSVSVSDEDISDYYEANMHDIGNDDEIRAAHILFAIPKGADKTFVDETRKKAESVLKLAQDGAGFETLAIKHSEGPSAPYGGDLGFFKRGDMVKEFSEAAFALNKGEISDIVLTPYGFHIIKVIDRREGAPVSFDQMKDKIRMILYNKRFEAAVMNFLQELKDKGEVNNLF